MRFTVSPLVLAVSLGLLNASALDAETPEEGPAEAVSPLDAVADLGCAAPVDAAVDPGPER